jgi:hypothetical protein
VRRGVPGRPLDLRAARFRAPEGDVGGDRVVEEQRVLGDDGDPVAERGERHVADVLPVDRDRAPRDVVKARHERKQRRFAGAGAADERGGPPAGAVNSTPSSAGASSP